MNRPRNRLRRSAARVCPRRMPRGRRRAMPKYLFMGSYTAEGARGVLKEGGSGGRAATEKLIQSLGGTLEAYYFAFGSDDFYLIADLPGNAAAAAGALTGAASGAIGTRSKIGRASCRERV